MSEDKNDAIFSITSDEVKKTKNPAHYHNCGSRS
ncbi:MAG: hypothetical protein UU18_C0010G0004 [Parcubacteria group bacterium GW2011_GWB2_40_8]|nr:MAG: hypothetical protein UU18_C0010G0004 [Parcubacteria group bacterium GW2011_GWB2_40_8]KKR77435.1 MAG: hypothetical protein UU20_C0007G0005 [Parcubacteria group bacterium GW2011_GWE2_40_8]KKR80549.1 MAG: hypothetical protein UU28_C0037G0003 [Parcubacteria group bacterium GW2011_GWD2_40_9]